MTHIRYRITPKRAGISYVVKYRKTLEGARKAARRELNDHMLPACSVVIEGTDGENACGWSWRNVYHWELVEVMRRQEHPAATGCDGSERLM